MFILLSLDLNLSKFMSVLLSINYLNRNNALGGLSLVVSSLVVEDFDSTGVRLAPL